MNLAQIAAAEQEIRGKLNHHVAARAVSIKETAKHDEVIASLKASLADLRVHAQAALDACERIADADQPAAPEQVAAE